jgi:hypothetical protein
VSPAIATRIGDVSGAAWPPDGMGVTKAMAPTLQWAGPTGQGGAPFGACRARASAAGWQASLCLAPRRATTTAHRWGAPDRTLVRALAGAGLRSNAARVVKDRLTFARWLRACPVCDSDAVRDFRMEPIDRALVHCLVRCGQCETWRAVFARRRAGLRIERRLERKRRRDRRRITRAAQRAWSTGGAALEIWLSGATAEPTTVAACPRRTPNGAGPSAADDGAPIET